MLMGGHRKNHQDKLLAAKEAALEHGEFNAAQNLELRIEQAFDDFLNVDIPDYINTTVEYLEPDPEDSCPQPLLNSLYNPIDLDHIAIKTPLHLVEFYKASGSFSRIPIEIIKTEIDRCQLLLTNFVKSTIHDDISIQHFMFPCIDRMATKVTFYEELWFLRNGLPKKTFITVTSIKSVSKAASQNDSTTFNINFETQ